MADALQGHVLLPLDCSREGNRPLAREHQVMAYPTFVILNSRGQPLARSRGYGNVERWCEWVRKAAADPVPIEDRFTRHAATPNFEDAVSLGRFQAAMMDYEEAVRLLSQAMELDAERGRHERVPAERVLALFHSARTEGRSRSDAAEALRDIMESRVVSLYDVVWLLDLFAEGSSETGREIYVDLLKTAHPILTQGDRAELDEYTGRVYWDLMADHALLIEQDEERALEIRKAGMPEGWRTDPDELNNLAWWCFEKRIQIAEAAEMARSAVDLASPGPIRANALDTLAELVNLQGHTDQALAHIREALELDPENGYLSDQLDRFETACAGTSSGSSGGNPE